MKHKMFTVYDQKAGAFLPPFMMHKDAMAQRVFADCCNDPSHNFGRHPEDYTLFRLGEFDDATAVVVVEPKGIQALGNGIEFLQVDRDDDQVDAFPVAVKAVQS